MNLLRADVYDAIADPTRRKLLHLLAGGEQSIVGLTAHFAMSRTAVVKHLEVLRGAALVTERKVGRERRYRLQAAQLRQVRDWVQFFERFWDERLDALGDFLDARANEPEH